MDIDKKTAILEELEKTDVTIKFYAKNYSIEIYFHVCTAEKLSKTLPVHVRKCSYMSVHNYTYACVFTS